MQGQIQDFAQGGVRSSQGGQGGGTGAQRKKKSSDISKYRYLDASNSNYGVRQKNCDFLSLIMHLPITMEISHKLQRL